MHAITQSVTPGRATCQFPHSHLTNATEIAVFILNELKGWFNYLFKLIKWMAFTICDGLATVNCLPGGLPGWHVICIFNDTHLHNDRALIRSATSSRRWSMRQRYSIVNQVEIHQVNSIQIKLITFLKKIKVDWIKVDWIKIQVNQLKIN